MNPIVISILILIIFILLIAGIVYFVAWLVMDSPDKSATTSVSVADNLRSAGLEINKITSTRPLYNKEINKTTLTDCILHSIGKRLRSKGAWFVFLGAFIAPSVVSSIDGRAGWRPIIISSLIGICCIGGYAAYRGLQLWKYESLSDLQKHIANKPEL